MKLCMINTVNDTGSTGRIASSLCRAVNGQGGESLFLYGRGTAPADIASVRVGNDASLLWHALRSRVTDRQGFYMARETGCAIQAMECFDPDIVHLHNVHGYYLHLPTLFAYLAARGTPVVWTLHDCFAMTGHCAHFSPAGCERWKTGCGDCPRKHAYPASLLLDRSKRSYAEKRALFTALPRLTVVAPCRWIRGIASDSFLGKFDCEVIFNGVELAAFAGAPGGFREQNGLAGNRIALAVASPWNAEKGWNDLIGLSERLPEEWRVVLIGVGEKQRKKLPPRMVGLPRTNGPESLAAAYAGADVYVNASHCETFPLTNLEALASGTPVVTYDVGGSSEAVDARCGRVVSVGDVDGLAQAVLAAQELSPADCLSRAAQFPMSRMISQYLGLYDRCVGRDGK